MSYLENNYLPARYVFYHIVSYKNSNRGDYKDFYDKYGLTKGDRDHFNYIFSVRDKLLSIGCSKSMATCISRNIMDRGIFNDEDLAKKKDTLNGPDCGKAFKKWLNNYFVIFVKGEGHDKR